MPFEVILLSSWMWVLAFYSLDSPFFFFGCFGFLDWQVFILRRKKELWKLKYFTMQKYNWGSQPTHFLIFSIDSTFYGCANSRATILLWAWNSKEHFSRNSQTSKTLSVPWPAGLPLTQVQIASFENPQIKIRPTTLGAKTHEVIIFYNESKHNILYLGRQRPTKFYRL